MKYSGKKTFKAIGLQITGAADIAGVDDSSRGHKSSHLDGQVNGS